MNESDTVNTNTKSNPNIIEPSFNCKHCNKELVSIRPRNLCSTCYYILDIRCQYAPRAKYYKAGVGVGTESLTAPRPLPIPTSSPPGTKNKLKVLVERAASGHELWHPKDAGRVSRTSDTYSSHNPEDMLVGRSLIHRMKELENLLEE